MNLTEKQQLLLSSGVTVEANAPVIISASRATDIPAFYSEWFFNRLKQGYSVWKNPFSGAKSYISFQHTRVIVFWSKNPVPLLSYLPQLERMHIHYYIQFTLNDYMKEGLEKGVPPLEERIDTFRQLVDYAGYGKVIWRFDPFILTDTISTEDLLGKVDYIATRLKGYTEKMVFSFADIESYVKVRRNLHNAHVHYKEFRQEDMEWMANELSVANKNWGYTLATCSERIDLSSYGIAHNKCIDDDLMIRFWKEDAVLMDYLGVEIKKGDLFHPEDTILKHQNNKDRGQREACGCIRSKDIGAYNTCPHLCEYCYANANKDTALALYKRIKMGGQGSETLTGE